MTFFLGQQVACIRTVSPDDFVLRVGFSYVPPKKGNIYTINWMMEGPRGLWLGFEEIDQRCCSHCKNFRPVRTTDTGMEMLNRLLLPKKARVRA